MTRLQTALLLVLAFATAAVLAQNSWSLLPAITTLITVVSALMTATGALFGAVPSWVWWVAFGITMSLLRPHKLSRFGGGCGRSRHRCAPASHVT